MVPLRRGPHWGPLDKPAGNSKTGGGGGRAGQRMWNRTTSDWPTDEAENERQKKNRKLMDVGVPSERGWPPV